MAIASLKGATVSLTGPGGSDTLKIGTGNVTWEERQTVEYMPNAGKISTADGGVASIADPEPVDLSLSGVWEYAFTDTNKLGSLHDTFVEADDTDCPPTSGTVVVTFPSGSCGPGITTITFNNLRWESITYSVEGGDINFSGKCVSNETSEAVVFAS